MPSPLRVQGPLALPIWRAEWQSSPFSSITSSVSPGSSRQCTKCCYFSHLKCLLCSHFHHINQPIFWVTQGSKTSQNYQQVFSSHSPHILFHLGFNSKFLQHHTLQGHQQPYTENKYLVYELIKFWTQSGKWIQITFARVMIFLGARHG